jgi:hypothetical protein
MKTILIVDKVSRQILSRYEAETPSQNKYGGPWGDPNNTIHLEVPAGADADCLDINESFEVSENVAARAAKDAAAVVANSEIAVAAAKAFGDKLLVEFAAENVRLGITADNMTETVLSNMQGIISALTTGSLHAAIARAKALTADKKDVKYITDARLLAAVNKIETFLGIPLSASL